MSDDEDSRCRKVCLTDAGRAYVEAHIEEGSERVRRLLDNLSPSEREELSSAMECVARLLDKA